jgi:hypothetical protein
MKTNRAPRLVLPLLAAFSVISLGTTAQAQQPAPAPTPPPAPPAAPPAAPVPPPSADVPPPQPPAEVPPPPVDVPPPPTATMDEKMADAEAKIEGLTESLAATNATLSPIAKLKFSGYIQGRYEWREDSTSAVDGMGRVTNFNRWRVRRARLKAVYAGENAEYLLQIDAVGPAGATSATPGDGVTLKDAEATFVDTWTPLGLRVTLGQFKVPFGYEILQSSGDREMPERARVIQALFPGERDRGLRITGRYNQLRFMAAVVNGNFTNDAFYGTLDQNRYSDLFGRIVGDFDYLVVGVSGEYGEKLPTTAASGMTPVTVRRYGLWRAGADAQAYIDVPGVGGLALKAEVVLGQETNRDFRGVAADPCRDVKQFGWILTGVQNIGDYLGVVARLDQWNPNRDVAAGTSMTCTDAAAAAATDKITTLGGGPLLFVSANLKASAVYEHLWRPARLAAAATLAPSAWVPTDQLTLQLQAKF